MLPTLLNGLGSQINPTPEPFSGIHYSKESIKGNILHGDKRGSTGEGEDSNRVYLPPRGAPAGVHVYEDNGQLFGKHQQIVARPHAYSVKGNYAIATVEDEPKWAQSKQAAAEKAIQAGMEPKLAELVSRNEAEWMLKDSGYSGYRSNKAPGSVILFGDVPVKALDKSKAEEQALQSINQPNQTMAQTEISEPNPSLDISDTRYPRKTNAIVPMESHNSHETHAANSDPADLQHPFQKQFNVSPKNVNELNILNSIPA